MIFSRIACRAFLLVPSALLVTLLASGWMPPDAWAAWSHDPGTNLALSTAAQDQDNPIAIPDGAGGAFVVWYGTIANDIFLQRVSANGTPLWTANGVPI